MGNRKWEKHGESWTSAASRRYAGRASAFENQRFIVD